MNFSCSRSKSSLFEESIEVWFDNVMKGERVAFQIFKVNVYLQLKMTPKYSCFSCIFLFYLLVRWLKEEEARLLNCWDRIINCYDTWSYSVKHLNNRGLFSLNLSISQITLICTELLVVFYIETGAFNCIQECTFVFAHGQTCRLAQPFLCLLLATLTRIFNRGINLAYFCSRDRKASCRERV